MSLPPVEVPAGAMRFNSDSQKLEYYDGAQWLQVSTFSPNLNGGARGVFVGGAFPANRNTIEYINISSTGNSIDFGDLTRTVRDMGACASSTRGVFLGGAATGPAGDKSNVIDFITFSSTGNATTFGSLSSAQKRANSAFSSSTRGISFGGSDDNPAGATVFNVMEYITIASTGNSVDFGDLSSVKFNAAGCASPTRGIIGGGFAPGLSNVIEYVTISTVGNVTDFGDLTTLRPPAGGGFSNPIRGLFAGGTSPSDSSVIDYVTISTLGNAVNFGNLSANVSRSSACSSSTRGVVSFNSSPANATRSNVIEYVTIATQGNSVDFGDVTDTGTQANSCSNAHGGL